jgi:dephospho-CoA kinase
MSVIGLTGGIATGKSTVSKLFKQHGLTVLDADEIAHHAYDQGSETYKAIVNRFDCLENGEISRAKLGAIVFHDEKARHDLEAIIHPFVKETMIEGIRKAEGQTVILDVPLLYEAHFDELCDQVVVVALDEDKEITRLMARNHLSREEAITRIKAQMPLSEKQKRADYVIDNSGSRQELRKQVDDFLRKVGVHAEK